MGWLSLPPTKRQNQALTNSNAYHSKSLEKKFNKKLPQYLFSDTYFVKIVKSSEFFTVFENNITGCNFYTIVKNSQL